MGIYNNYSYAATLFYVMVHCAAFQVYFCYHGDGTKTPTVELEPTTTRLRALRSAD